MTVSTAPAPHTDGQVRLEHEAVCLGVEALADHIQRVRGILSHPTEPIVDLMTDLLHVAAAQGSDPQRVLLDAYDSFLSEARTAPVPAAA